MISRVRELSMKRNTNIRGRYAPSPTGFTHLGNARTALLAWLSIRSQGGTFVWRLEDLDSPRNIEGAAEDALADLLWLGLDFDEGANDQGPHTPYRQSQRSSLYEDAMRSLAQSGRTFPCKLSRKDLASAASAPHTTNAPPPYPADNRPTTLAPNWYSDLTAMPHPDAAVRFRVDDQTWRFQDLVYGTVEQDLARSVGDFVLKRKDGLYAYQLAVVVDDLLMKVTEVVRGNDLLDSTPRQLALCDALAGQPPLYAHVPLLLESDGTKLSKRDNGLSVRALREEGLAPEQVVGWLAHSAGLTLRAEACSAESLICDFGWDRVSRENTALSPETKDEISSCT
jgi:glutamyl-tRNA synthetase